MQIRPKFLEEQTYIDLKEEAHYMEVDLVDGGNLCFGQKGLGCLNLI